MFLLLFVALELQFRKQAVPRERLVQRMQELTLLCIVEQRIQRSIRIYCLYDW